MKYLQKRPWKEAPTKIAVLIFCFIALVPNMGRAQEDSVQNSMHSRLAVIFDMRTAYQFSNKGIQKIEWFAKPEWEVQFSKNLRFKIVGRVYIDAMNKLEPGKPQQVEVSRFSRRGLIGDVLEIELRECYYDLKIGKHYITAGKQQIVWGKADGLKILDVVNPTNFREFLLDDFDNSRIPLWSVKTDINLSTLKLQLVWIPDQTYHDIPDERATFYPGALFPKPPPGIAVTTHPLKKPDRFFRDADAGFRISSFIDGWDITLNYLYMYDDFPVAKIAVSDNPAPALIVSPLYKRHHMAGGTFSNSFGKFAVRGELGFFINKYFSTTDATQPEGLFKSSQIMMVAGVDYSGFSNSLISLQVFEDYIVQHISVAGRRQGEPYLSLLANRSFKNETFTAEIIGVQSIHSGGGFIRPSLRHQLKSNIIVKAGGDLFYGAKDHLFGQFTNTTRVTLGVQVGL
jgi:hypothetical protein